MCPLILRQCLLDICAENEPSDITHLSTMSSLNAAKDAASQVISETAKTEGGPVKGSTSAQMQSEVTRARNAEPGVNNTSNKSAAGQMISDVAKEEGGTTKGSASAKMQSEVSKARNAGVGQTMTSEPIDPAVDPAVQSQMDRGTNLAEAEEKVIPKMQEDPEQVTKEDANLLRSRETRAHGSTQKGGVAATAQHMAAENEKKGKI